MFHLSTRVVLLVVTTPVVGRKKTETDSLRRLEEWMLRVFFVEWELGR